MRNTATSLLKHAETWCFFVYKINYTQCAFGYSTQQLEGLRRDYGEAQVARR